MTDKKLTDEEIMKALERCIGWESCKEKQCPMINECEEDLDALYEHVLDLINRQKSEIEELKEKFTLDFEKMESEYDGKIKAEAYKEFAERLKSYLLLNKKGSMSVVSFENIDTLLKRMVGEKE